MDRYFLITVVVIISSLVNICRAYKQTQEFLETETINMKKAPKWMCRLFKLQDKPVSSEGKGFALWAYLPITVLSAVCTVLMIRALILINGRNEITVIDYYAHIIAVAAIVVYLFAYTFVNVLIVNEETIQKHGFLAFAKSVFAGFVRVPIYTWVIALLCFSPLLIFGFKIISFFICCFSAFLAIKAERFNKGKGRTGGVLFIQIAIVAIVFFLVFLFNTPLE